MIPQELLQTRITGERDGLPRFDGVILKIRDGAVRAYRDRPCKPWEEPEEAAHFPADELVKIQAAHDDDLDALTENERRAVSENRKATIREARAAAYVAKTDGLAYEALEKEKRGEDASQEWDQWLERKQQIRHEHPYPGE